MELAPFPNCFFLLLVLLHLIRRRGRGRIYNRGARERGKKGFFAMSEEANEASLIFVSVKEGEEREGREKKRKKCIGLKYKTPTKF